MTLSPELSSSELVPVCRRWWCWLSGRPSIALPCLGIECAILRKGLCSSFPRSLSVLSPFPPYLLGYCRTILRLGEAPPFAFSSVRRMPSLLLVVSRSKVSIAQQLLVIREASPLWQLSSAIGWEQLPLVCLGGARGRSAGLAPTMLQWLSIA